MSEPFPKIELHGRSLGIDGRTAYEAGLAGALCDDDKREHLRMIGESFDWASLT